MLSSLGSLDGGGAEPARRRGQEEPSAAMSEGILSDWPGPPLALVPRPISPTA
jgi:hypothetical protein